MRTFVTIEVATHLATAFAYPNPYMMHSVSVRACIFDLGIVTTLSVNQGRTYLICRYSNGIVRPVHFDPIYEDGEGK